MRRKSIKKIVVRTVITILCVVLIFSASVFFSGYSRYREVSKEKPMDIVVDQIQDIPNYANLGDVSDNFLSPLIAVEDPEFYDHNGFRIINILEAMFENVKATELVEGGSTITQQLSKNLFLDQKKEFDRKVAELFFSLDLEGNYNKEEILELYINTSYFGDGYYGIYDASMGYFNVAPSELTLAQGAMLAGLLQAPSAYQLSSGYDLAKQRQRIVLDEMVKQNIISDELAKATYKITIYN